MIILNKKVLYVRKNLMLWKTETRKLGTDYASMYTMFKSFLLPFQHYFTFLIYIFQSFRCASNLSSFENLHARDN